MVELITSSTPTLNFGDLKAGFVIGLLLTIATAGGILISKPNKEEARIKQPDSKAFEKETAEVVKK